MTKEKKIEYFSYFYNSSKSFVEENYDCFVEMEKILKRIFKDIDEMKKDYDITLGEGSIGFENKKTKESYSISIEF